jgi:hypothetical protein
MTPPADHPPVVLPADVAAPVLRISDQGELVAAIPAMLGFHPRESLVLMATGGRSGRRIGLTLRIDLPPPDHPEYAEHADLIAGSVTRGVLLDEPAGAICVVVSGSGAPPGRSPGELPHRPLAARVARELEQHAVPVLASIWAERTAGGARWACYQPCGCAGTMPDPAATTFVAAVVADGRVVHADRAELVASVAPADPARIRRREEQLIRATEGEIGDGGPVVLDAPAGIEELDAAIADAADGRLTLPDARVLALATALGIDEVRACALRRCAGPQAAAAEQLWAALARETPDPESAGPAALLAMSALLRGDGALANVALDRAEQAWPGHAFAALVRRAAAAGLRPSQIRATLLGEKPLGDADRGVR